MFDRAMWQVNKEHHNELIDVTRAQQLIKELRTERRRTSDSFFVNVGDLLVSLGLRLKARHESPIH